ncbi:hypothetical protein [Fibrobacter intestinalis]|nr:hypothetical protein [Fibrobacter intestinalis]
MNDLRVVHSKGTLDKILPDLLALRQAVPEFIEGQGPVKSWELGVETDN